MSLRHGAAVLDLDTFIADPELDLASHEARLLPKQVKTWLLSGDHWVSGFIINGYECYVIGGPDFIDGRVFATLQSALAAVVQNLNEVLSKEVFIKTRKDLNVVRPKQREFEGGYYLLKLVSSKDYVFLTVGAKGPRGQILKDYDAADSAAHDMASGMTGYN